MNIKSKPRNIAKNIFKRKFKNNIKNEILNKIYGNDYEKIPGMVLPIFGPVFGLNVDEAAAEDVIRELREIGLDVRSGNREYYVFTASNIDRAVRAGIPVQEAKEMAMQMAIDRFLDEVENNISNLGKHGEPLKALIDDLLEGAELTPQALAALSFAQEVAQKGREWWAAAVGSEADAKDNDPCGHVDGVTAEIVADLVREGVSLPGRPETITQAYDFARGSGHSKEEAKDFAYGIAKGVAEANERMDADIRSLREAASWAAVSEKNQEQKGNIDIQKAANALNNLLGGQRGSAAGVQAASVGVPDLAAELLSRDGAVAGFKQAQSRAQSAQTPWSKPAGPYDFVAEILGTSRPETVSTPMGEVVLGRPEWSTEEEIKALMRSPEYSNANLPQSKPVRDTVRGYYAAAYPGPAKEDEFGRIDVGPAVSRPASAPDIFQGKRSLASPAAVAPNRSPALGTTDLRSRRDAVTAGVEAAVGWPAVQERIDARLAEQTRRDKQKATEIDQRRADRTRKAEAPISVTPPKTDYLGGTGMKKSAEPEKLSDVEKAKAVKGEAAVPMEVQAAQARNRRQETEAQATNAATKGGGSGTSDGPDGESGWRSPGPGQVGIAGKPDAVTRGLNSLFGNAPNWAGTVTDKTGTYGAYYTGKEKEKESSGGEESRVICTELVRQGLMDAELYFLDLRFARERLKPVHLRGYHLWAVPLVRRMRASRRLTRIVAAPALWRAEEIAFLLGKRPQGNFRGRIVRWIGEPLCRLLGSMAPETDYRKLYEQESL